MKKIFFAAAVVGVALTGCVSNEAEIAPKGDSKITFAAPLVSGISRAVTGEINNPYPDGEQFAAFAKFYRDGFSSWADGEWYFGATGGVAMKYDSNVNGWAPSDGTEYYWPKNGSLTFYAYSPADYETWKPAIEDEQMQAVGVNIPAEAANVDLMYSELAKDKTEVDRIEGNNGNTGVEYYGVELRFKHALSSIQFKAKLSRGYNASIVLNKIELKQAKSQGSFSWALNSAAAPVWNTDVPVDYTVVSDAAQSVTETAAAVTGAKPMILLPQTLAGVTAEVSYTVDGREFKSEIKLADWKHGEQDTPEWQSGKRYIYTIIFSLNTIYFDPTVANWDTIDVTYQNPDETGNI